MNKHHVSSGKRCKICCQILDKKSGIILFQLETRFGCGHFENENEPDRYWILFRQLMMQKYNVFSIIAPSTDTKIQNSNEIVFYLGIKFGYGLYL